MLQMIKDRLRRRPKSLAKEEYVEKMRSRGYNDDGQFIPDGTPMAPPIGYKRQLSMVEVVRNMVRDERLAAELDAMGVETFEEADDFDVGDEAEDLRSGWENDFDPPIRDMIKAGHDEVVRKAAKAQAELDVAKKEVVVEAPKGARDGSSPKE